MKASTKFADILKLVVVPVCDHPNHFDVSSESEPGTSHRVRLNTTHQAVACECADWLYNATPKLNKGQEPFQTPTLCKHIAATIWFDACRKLAARKP